MDADINDKDIRHASYFFKPHEIVLLVNRVPLTKKIMCRLPTLAPAEKLEKWAYQAKQYKKNRSQLKKKPQRTNT